MILKIIISKSHLFSQLREYHVFNLFNINNNIEIYDEKHIRSNQYDEKKK